MVLSCIHWFMYSKSPFPICRMILLSGSMEEFEAKIKVKPSNLGELWDGVKRVLKLQEVGDALRRVSMDECMDVIFSHLPPKHYQLQVSLVSLLPPQSFSCLGLRMQGSAASVPA